MTTNAIRLTSPQELLAIVPFVLGFHPTNSIMVLCLTNNRLGLAQRLDIPQSLEAHDVSSALLPSLVVENRDTVILIGYEDRIGDSLAPLASLTAALDSAGMKIHDTLVVHAGRWRSPLDCHSPGCCPPGGSLVPEAKDASRVVAEFIGQGVAPHPDRDSMAEQLEPGAQAVAVSHLMRSRQKERKKAGDCPAFPRVELFAAWPRILDCDASVISADDAALAAVSLLDIEVRDGLVAFLCPGTISLDELSEDVQKLFSGLGIAGDMEDIHPSSTGAQNSVQDALIRLCAMLPDDLAAPALSVLASFTWWRGDGALTRVALARALRCDPDYRLAQLLEQMVDLAIRPVGR